MKKTIWLIILIAAVPGACALNDINLTIQNAETPLCISDQSDLTSQICNQTSYLTLDGSADHILYYSYQKPIPDNSTIYEIGIYLINEHFVFISAFGLFIAIGIIILVGVNFVAKWLGF